MGLGDALKERWTQLTEYWGGLSLNQKVLVAGALLLLIVAIAIPSATLMKTDYVILYNKLEVNDAAAMKAKLDELSVPYQLADNGSTIMVPADQKDNARLQLASAGLPKGVAGFDSFNTTNFGETETDKKVKYQVALQGELTKTIQSLNQVEFAKVNLAIPEESLFTEEQKNPTASVLVKTKPYMELTPKEVQGIIHLVASSVQGLKAEDVTVVDTNGSVLSDNVGGADVGSTAATTLTQTQILMKRKYEKDTQNSVQSMLEKILGPGKAVVRVAAELNFDEKQSHKETWGPNSFVRSEKLDDESSTNAESGTEGVPGTQSNIPTYQTGGTTGGTSSSEKSSKTRNYEIDSEVVDQKFALGDVKRLTISVIVDKELNAKSKQEIQDAVAAASGFKVERGDTISVSGMKFSQAPPEPEVTPGITDYLSQYGTLVGIVVAVLLFLVIMLMTRRKKKTEDEHSLDMLVGEEIKVEDLLERELSPQDKEKKKIREEIEKLVDHNAEDVAQLIRTWLLEEGR